MPTTVKYIYWQSKDAWIGYLEDYPKNWTQGETLEDLEEHLRDLYAEFSSGEVQGIQRLGEFVVP